MIKLDVDGCTIWAVPGRTEKDGETLLTRAGEVGRARGASIQIADADKIFGIDHLRSAFSKAVRAFKAEENVSNSLVTETMLYLSGCRQIQEALELIGVGKKTERIVLLMDKEIPDVLEQLSLQEDDGVLSPEGKNPKCLGITDTEMSTVPGDKVVDLVLERVASVDIKKK